MVTPLAPHPSFQPRPGPVVLCILDGVGIGAGGEDDAVATSRHPNLDALLKRFPWTKLQAHGTAVGMPSDEDMGNSEVGHNAMGCGRVFGQGAGLVDLALRSGSAWAGEAWRQLCKGNTLHLMGLLSDGNVHSNVKHVHALVERAAVDGVKRLRIHALTDGRDVGGRSALLYIEPLEQILASHRALGRDYRFGSGGGRMWITMDRYGADWAMVKRGWDCHVHAVGRPFASASEAVRTLYEDPKLTDQWLPAFVVLDEKGQSSPICDGDGVLFFNFRGDRAIEISRAFEDDTFPFFDRGRRPSVTYAGMMRYDGDSGIPKRYLVEPPAIDGTVGQYLAAAGKRTFACSETQKFGHVTYFFNGNRSGKIDETLEQYLEIPSDNLPFDERPWMKAAEITDAVVAAIRSGGFHHVRLNFPNGDMVGHTGALEPTRIAIEAMDVQIGRLWEAVRNADGILLVTADHGNAEEKYSRDKTGAVMRDGAGLPVPRPSHSLNPVPFVVCDPREATTIGPLERPGLASVGGTILELCGLTVPAGYLPGLVVPR